MDSAHSQAAPIDALFDQAAGLLEAGRLAEADELYARILQADPCDCEALHRSGLIAARTGRWQRAVELMQRSLEYDPHNAETHCNLGTVYKTLGQHQDALDSYDSALQAAPDTAAIHFNRALILHELQSYAEALQGYSAALSIDPTFTMAFNAAGLMLHRLGRPLEAVAHYQRAIELDPAFAEAHNNCGCVLRELGDLTGALHHFSRAIEQQNDFVQAHSNRGAAYTELGRFAAALADFDRAVELLPDLAQARCNRSYIHLLNGDLAAGWPDYEWRARIPGSSLAMQHRDFDRPQWRGESPLAGKTVLTYSEQGFGDSIQFCRYVGKLAAAGARVIVEVPAALVALLETLPGVSRVLARGSPLPDFDYHVPLMSLPFACRTTLASIPAEIPYLKADPHKMACWSKLLGPRRRLRVGLVWSGGLRPDQPTVWAVNRRRNIALEKLAILRNPDIDFYSLQKGEPARSELAELQRRSWDGPTIIDHTDRLHDFSDTAACLSQLDLVISVDTSTAHLAGALGKPVWMLNRYDTCWRWLLERTDTPWYPSFTIYRQRSSGDWDPVVDRVRADLDRWAADFASGRAGRRSGEE